MRERESDMEKKSSIGKKELLFLLVVMLYWFSMNITVPYFTPYMKALGISASVMGLITGLYGFAQLLLRIPIGITADIHKCHKTFMISGLIAQAIGSAVVFFPSVPVFYISKFLGGISAAAWVSYTVYFMSLIKGEKNIRATSLLFTANNTGMLTAYLLGGVLYEKFGMNANLIGSIAAALAAAAMLAFMKIKTENKAAAPMKLSKVTDVLKNKRLLICSMLAAMIQFLRTSTNASFTTSYLADIGASGTQIGLATGLFTAAAIISSFTLSTKLSKYFSDKALLVTAFLLSAASCFILANTNSIPIILVFQFGAGFGQAIISSVTMASCSRELPPEIRSTAMGAYQSLYSLGLTFGPIVMGYLVGRFTEYKIPFGAMGVLGLVSAVCVLLLYKYKD